MRYDTKKKILEHLGKKGKDVRGLDRLIRLGIVLEKDGRYMPRADLERTTIIKLRDRVKELEAENLKLQKVAEGGINARYYEELYDKECEERENIIKRCYDYMKDRGMKIKWDEYNAWVNGDLIE